MMNRLKILFVLLILVAGTIAGLFVREMFYLSPKTDAVPIIVTIESGANVSSIAHDLKQAHVIDHPTFFKWAVNWTHSSTKMQSGTFSFLPNTSLLSIILTMTNPANSEVQITIPEGFTNDQIEDRLAAAFADFDRLAWKEQTKNIQGYLFPDTYRFAKTATVKEIVDKMRLTLDRRLSEIGFVPTPTLDKKALLILASIVEKEVQTPADMGHAAGVFFNRLQIDMPLQTDAAPETYKTKGLPGAPICNPGLNAITAVLHPLKTDDFYFIAPPDHAPVFAKTLEEQIANQRKYLK